MVKMTKESLIAVALGAILVVSGLYGFARYGLETEHHYLFSIKNLSSIIIGSIFLIAIYSRGKK